MISDIQEVPSPSPAVRPSDRLSLAIGRVCQADVWLEYSLVSLYRSLAGPGLGSAVPPVTFATLLSSGRTMLRLADLPEPWAAAARDALSAAEHAHSVRNKYVHDIWLGDLQAQDPHHFLQLTHDRNWLSQRTERHRIDVIERAVEATRRASDRIRLLTTALPRLLPWLGATGRDGPSLDELAIVQGKFERGADGSIRPLRS